MGMTEPLTSATGPPVPHLFLPLHTDTPRHPGKDSYSHFIDRETEMQKDNHTTSTAGFH